MEQACAELPKAKLKNKCLSAIEKNADFIIDLLLKEVTPKEVCLALGFCFTSINDDVIEVVPLLDARPTPNPEYVCRLCQVVVQKIEDQLNNKSTQEDIENCVKQVCNGLPKKLQSKCRSFIDAYANELIKYLPNEPPKEVCKKACICPGESDDDYVDDDVIPDDFGKKKLIDNAALMFDDNHCLFDLFTDSGFDVTQENIFTSPECVLCEQVIHEVEKKVQNDKSRVSGFIFGFFPLLSLT